MSPIVIVGGGHAAAQLCAGLVDRGRGADVALICDEEHLPYQRPPLSKSFIKDSSELVQLHRAESYYHAAGVALHRADAAVAIDRERRTVALRSGRELRYDRLVLATGARARWLPALPERLINVAALRGAPDAERLRTLIAAASRITVLGGGFIGLEIAATARALGKAVSVIEAAPRLLARAVSTELSAHVQTVHAASGMDLRLGAQVDGFEIEADRLVALRVNGAREPVELLVLGIGAGPAIELAQAAGLACERGIVVDACMRTSDESVLAIGDCTNFPDRRSGHRLRLESVQNANDQARTALATLMGEPRPHDALAWFWSDQGTLRLQMAGLALEPTTLSRRPGANAQSFSILHYAGDALVCVESVNAPMDHMMARKLLEARKSPPAAVASDPTVPLKSLL